MSNVVDIQSSTHPGLRSGDTDRASRWGGYEPFVDEHVIASFLDIEPRQVLEMARKGLIPAHPLGDKRMRWRFKISEIDAHFRLPNQKRSPATISLAVPVTQERKRIG